MEAKLPMQANSKLPRGMAAEIGKIREATGLRTADLIRIGLRRVIAEFRRDGYLTLKSEEDAV